MLQPLLPCRAKPVVARPISFLIEVGFCLSTLNTKIIYALRYQKNKTEKRPYVHTESAFSRSRNLQNV